MLKLLFITLGHLSSGEFTIAVEFAKRLSVSKYKIIFLTSEEGYNYLSQNGFETFVVKRSYYISKNENERIIKQFIEQFAPNFLILSDVYTFDFSYIWTGLKFSHLKEYGIKIASFDEYEYRSNNYEIDYYGDFKSLFLPLINECNYLLAHCPLNKPVTNKHDDLVFNLSLYGEKFILLEEEKQRIRQKFSLDGTIKKLVFTATSKWESINMNNFAPLTTLLRWVPRIILEYLDNIGEKIALIHIGPQRWDTSGLMNIFYNHFSYLHPVDFDKMIFASDLFITTNLVSVTLSKAIFGNVPSIVINNDKIIDFNKFTQKICELPVWYQKMARDVGIAYPYHVFPFGWYNFLKTILENNSYLDTFIQAPLFQVSKCINTLKTYLLDCDYREALRKKQLNYVENMLKLATPEKIIATWEQKK